MKRKTIGTLAFVLFVLAMLILSGFLITSHVREEIRRETSRVRIITLAYLSANGYEAETVENIEIQHSFLNRTLGFNEWRIFVRFKKIPGVTVCLSYKNDVIVFYGVNVGDHAAPEVVIAYSEKFKNGTLLDD